MLARWPTGAVGRPISRDDRVGTRSHTGWSEAAALPEDNS